MKRIVAKNALIITLGSLALKAINFIYNVAVIRQLGDDRFGQLSTVTAFVGLFSIFAELGVSQYVMREIAQRPEKTKLLFWNLIALRLTLAIIGVIGITAMAAVFGFREQLLLGVLLYTLTFIYSAFLAPLDTLVVAAERFEYQTAMLVVGQIATVLLGAVVLINNWGFVALIAVGLLAMFPPIFVGVWAARRHRLVSRPISIAPQSWPGLIRAGLPFGVISLALTIAFSIDSVMLSRWNPPEVVGWYNAAYQLAKSLLFLFSGFSVAIVPTLSKAYVHEPETVARWYYRSVRVILLLGLPIVVGGMIVAYPLIHFLYGDEYLPAARAFQIIVWDVPLLMFASFCGNMTTVVSEERAAARVYVIGAIANVVLNFIFIPPFSLIGAAAVTVVTDLVAAFQFHLLLGRKLNLPNVTSLALKIAVASGVMGLVVALAGSQHLFIQIGLGVIVYALCALILRLLDAEEWALISRLLHRIRFVPAKM